MYKYKYNLDIFRNLFSSVPVILTRETNAATKCYCIVHMKLKTVSVLKLNGESRKGQCVHAHRILKGGLNSEVK